MGAFNTTLTTVNKDCSGFDYSVTDASGAGTTGQINLIDYSNAVATTATSVTFTGPGATSTGTIALTTHGLYTLQWVVGGVVIDQMAYS